jgi:hypothetical protein
MMEEGKKSNVGIFPPGVSIGVNAVRLTDGRGSDHDGYDGGKFADADLPFWPDVAKKEVAVASSHCCGSAKHP